MLQCILLIRVYPKYLSPHGDSNWPHGKFLWLFIHATDSDGYNGPVTSVFVEVSDSEPPSRG